MNTKALMQRRSIGSYEENYLLLDENGSLIDELEMNDRDYDMNNEKMNL